MNEVFAILLPGMMYFWVLFVGQVPFQEILYEKETHTLARLLVSPVTATQYVLSKMLRCFLLCAVIQTGLLALSAGLFRIHWGSFVGLALAVGASSLSMCGLLSLIYSLAASKEHATVMTPIVLLICALFGGSMIPFDQLPPPLQMAGRFSPNRWGVLAYQSVMQQKSFAELWAPLTVLSVFGVCASGAAFALFERRFKKGGAQ